MPSLAIVVVGAGRGSRLQKDVPENKRRPKAFYEIGGKPMISYVLEEAAKLNPDAIFLVHPPGWGDRLEGFPGIKLIPGGKGPLADIFIGIKAAEEYDEVLVINGDAILVDAKSLRELRYTLASGTCFVWPAINPEACLPDKSVKYIPGTMNRRPNVLAVRPKEIRWGWLLRMILRMKNNKFYTLVGELLVVLSVIGPGKALSCVRLLVPPEAWWIWGLWTDYKMPFPKFVKGVIGRRYFGFELPSWKLAHYMGRFLGCDVAIPIMNEGVFAFDVDFEEDALVALRELKKAGRI